jgi:hypothetical protein
MGSVETSLIYDKYKIGVSPSSVMAVNGILKDFLVNPK